MTSLDEFFRENYGRHKGTIRRVIRHDEDAVEDIVMTAYLKAHEKFPQYDPKKGSMTVWFNSILFNTLRDEQRRFQRQPQLCGLAEDQPFEPQARDHGIDLERLINKYKCSEVARRVIRLVYIIGYTSPEAARAVGVSPTNARTICSRFRQEVTAG